MPLLHQEFAMLLDQLFYLIQFMCRKSLVVLKLHDRIDPKLRLEPLTPHMNMRRLINIRREESKPIRPNP